MRVGIVARAELQRGIGVQSWEYARHLDPAKVLIVDVGDYEQFAISPEAFPHPTVVRMSPTGHLPERECREWLQGLDVVLSVETFYDWRFCDWARDAQVRTVVHANPEFYRHGHFRLPHPDGWWNPTTWRMQFLPEGTIHVPVPVALDRFRSRPPDVEPRSRGPRFLHPIGKWAMYDRNGTESFLRASYLAGRIDATVTALAPLPEEVRPGGDWVRVVVRDVPNYWDAYSGFDVLVLPRRYGGLCLPAQEAMAAGLAVVMPTVPPNEDWPIIGTPARTVGRVPLPAGWVEMCDLDPGLLANILVELQDSPGLVDAAKARSLEWAEAHSWDRLTPLYLDRLQRTLDHPSGPPRVRQTGHNPFAAPERT